MSKLKSVGVFSGLPGEVAKEVIVSVGKELAQDSINWAKDGLSEAQIRGTFQSPLENVSRESGALFGFATFSAPDGSEIVSGPIFFGSGKSPHDPLVNMGFSSSAIRGLGNDISVSLQPSAGLQWKTFRFYWAVKLPNGSIEFFRADSESLMANAIGSRIRVEGLALQASSGPNTEKLANQATLFNELEDQLRDEIRSSGIEGQLLTIRSRMREAQALYERAGTDRDAALARARSSQSLDNFRQVLGMASLFAKFTDDAMKDANYNQTEMQGAVVNYNNSVTTYNELVIHNTNINKNVLPESPQLTMPEPPTLERPLD